LRDKDSCENPQGVFHTISSEKADAHPAASWADIQASFLLSKQVANCSAQTLKVYRDNLGRFQREAAITTMGDVNPLAIQRHLTRLRDAMKPFSVHQHLRVLKTFCRWAAETGTLAQDPMRGISMKVPRTLPRVPTDETVRKLLGACGESFEGRRNKALVGLLADSGLRRPAPQ
jgi:site-specific recombinase XerD